MQQEFQSVLRSLKQQVETLILPIEAGEFEFYGEDSHKVKSGLDLMMGELSMVILLFTDLDGEITDRELELLNDMRHVVYGHGVPDLEATDPMELRRQLLRAHPDRLLTVDHLPLSIRLLDIYDKSNGTGFGRRARGLFLEFIEAMISVDRMEHPSELLLLENFKEVLSAGTDDNS